MAVCSGVRGRALAGVRTFEPRADCLLQFADYNLEVFISHENSGSESTLINWSF